MASAGETGNERDSSPLMENLLYCCPGNGPELGDVAGSSSVAGTDETDMNWGGLEGAVGLACGTSMKFLPAGCRWCDEQVWERCS